MPDSIYRVTVRLSNGGVLKRKLVKTVSATSHQHAYYQIQKDLGPNEVILSTERA